MASGIYPVNTGDKGSRIDVVPDSGVQLSSMADGGIRGFTDYSEPTFRLTITHPLLTKAEADAIKGFYDGAPLDFHTVATQLEGTFSALFINRPAVTEKAGPLMTVVTEMIGTIAA